MAVVLRNVHCKNQIREKRRVIVVIATSVYRSFVVFTNYLITYLETHFMTRIVALEAFTRLSLH